MPLSASPSSAESKVAFTIKEAVRASGLSRSLLYVAISRGALQARKCGARTLILRFGPAPFSTASPSAHQAWRRLMNKEYPRRDGITAGAVGKVILQNLPRPPCQIKHIATPTTFASNASPRNSKKPSGSASPTTGSKSSSTPTPTLCARRRSPFSWTRSMWFAFRRFPKRSAKCWRADVRLNADRRGPGGRRALQCRKDAATIRVL